MSGREEECRKTASGRPPAGLSEHDDGAGAALEGSLHSADGDGLRGVAGQMSDAAQLLEHLSVEHGGLCLTGNLDARGKNEDFRVTAAASIQERDTRREANS